MNDFNTKDTYQASEVKRMKAVYEQGGLNRREFLQSLLAVGVTVTTATAILTGSYDVQAATPKKGGKLKVAVATYGPTYTLDPALFTEGLSYSRGRAHSNLLIQFNDDLTVGPELAESWEVNSDGTEFTFNLLKGVTWHDGKDFTADDVAYSMNTCVGLYKCHRFLSEIIQYAVWLYYRFNVIHRDIEDLLARF